MAASEEIVRTLGLARESEPRVRRIPLFAGLGLVAVALLVGAFWWWTRETPIAYETAPVERGPLVAEVTAIGSLEPVTLVEVGTEISGRIAAVHVDYNDAVEEGMILAELDTEQLDARVVQARANLAVARAREQEAAATLREARNRSARVTELAREQTFSQQELEVAEATLARAEAGLTSARAQGTLMEAALDADLVMRAKAAIRAPIGGIVISRNIEPGQTVASSFQTPVFFTIAEDLAEMRLHVDVDEADVGQVAEGQIATFQVDAYPRRRFEAKVLTVRNAAREVQGVVTYEALLAVENREMLLRPGMTATARIVTSELDDAVLVPNGALRFAPPEASGAAAPPAAAAPGTRVYVLRDGEPVAIPVGVGLSDGRRSELVEGDLAVGTALIVDVQRDEAERGARR